MKIVQCTRDKQNEKRKKTQELW